METKILFGKESVTMAKKVSRGITALLANVEDVREEKTAEEVVVKVPLDRLKPNPDQPRKTFDPDTIRELATSIKENGVIQPLVVKKDGGDYMIIAGERRFRAAKVAGLSTVPVIVREMTEQKIREVSLIENLQREDLNAIEEAEAIAELMENYNVTQEELSGRIGKSRSAISNSIRLLNLPDEIKETLKDGTLTAGHGRALLAIDDPEVQIEVAKKAIAEGWSVREIEKEVRYVLRPETRPTKLTETVKKKMSLEMRRFVDDMTEVFATKVRLMGNEQKGRITIDYFTNDDLQRIYEIIETLKK